MHQAQALLAVVMAGLFAGVASSETVATEPTPTAPEFEIMSDQEVQLHRERMAKLSEAAREAYRNAEYQKLKQRAEQEGYQLPAAPPWSQSLPIDGQGVGETGVQLTAAGSDENPPPRAEPSEAYRAIMKQRFERYLEQRAERRAAAAASLPTIETSPPAEARLAEQRESAARQRADQQTRIEQRKAEMEARREGYRQQIEEKNAEATARAEQRQAELNELRSGTAEQVTTTTAVTDSGPADAEGARHAEIREQLERLREANAAERQELRDQADQRIARQKAELESLRSRRGEDAVTPPDSATVRSANDSAVQASGPEPGEALARSETTPGQTRAAETKAAAPAEVAADDARAAASPEKPAAAAPPAPAPPSAYYYGRPVYPAYPVMPYPAYPYYPNPYWNRSR